jgi:hypothetical protein
MSGREDIEEEMKIHNDERCIGDDSAQYHEHCRDRTTARRIQEHLEDSSKYVSIERESCCW